MSEVEQRQADDELELAPDTIEDLDAEGDEVKGGETKIRYTYDVNQCN